MPRKQQDEKPLVRDEAPVTDAKPVPAEAAAKYDVDAPEMPPLIGGKPTVDGRPIPADFEHVIPYAATDQGRWERSQGKEKPNGVKVTGDAWDRMIEERRDQPWAASDPIQEAIDTFGEKGFRYRAMSPMVCEQRGMRGWEPVKKENGDHVKIGGMFLGRMPEHVAEQRNAHYRSIGNEQLKNAAENLQIDQERVIRDAGKQGRGITPLRPGTSLTDSRDSARAAVVGVESVRGQG
jgi:hypothetical protein